MQSLMSRRSFLAGAILLAHAAAAPTVAFQEDCELCMLRSMHTLPYSDAWVEMNGREGMLGTDQERARSDFIESLEVGDVVELVPPLTEGGIISLDTARGSSMSFFVRESTLPIYDALTRELKLGTPLHAVVKWAEYLPGVEWMRNVWFSIHALETDSNRMRLKAIAVSNAANRLFEEYNRDAKSYEFLNSPIARRF